MYIHLNLNPYGQDTGDCVIRALTLALNYNWFMVHDELSFLSRKMADMPSSNRVWKTYLGEKGYREQPAQNTCPNCLTVEQFCRQHPVGRYILSTCEYTKARDNLIVTGTHVVTVIDGDWYMSYMGGSYDDYMGRSYNMAPQYRQSYDNGYSRDSTYSHLEQAMRDARSDQEREEIRALMTRLYK